MIGILNLQALKNATFDEVPFEILIDNVPLDLTDAIVKMQIKKDTCSSPLLTLTSVANNGITITDAVNGKFKINSQIITLPICNYEYDIQITLPSGEVDYYVGGLFQVVKTITI